MFHQFKETATVSLDTALTVLQFGWATIDQLRTANAWRLKQCPRIGKLALISGKLSRAEVLTVLAEQRSIGKTFGQTAVGLGLLNQAEVYELLLLQSSRLPTLAESLVALEIVTLEQAEQAVKNHNAYLLTAAPEEVLDPVLMS